MRKIVILLITVLLFAGSGIAGQSLPPDPGKAGKQTLLGIDSDNDGVRDDIQRYIYFTYPDDERTRTALTYIAKQFQELLPQANDRDAALQHATLKARHGECLYYIMGAQSGDARKALKAEILNTEERSSAYILYSNNLAGKILIKPPLKEWKNSCAFDIDVIGKN